MATFDRAEDIKVGVVGYGGAFNMGKKHLDEMQKAGMTPAAVAEIDAQRLGVASADFPDIRTYDSLDQMLDGDDVNLVTIITPHNTHAELALKALRSGKHVVCEKPLAITTEECTEMISAAKDNGVIISTYHNRHWDGCILEALDHIGSGMIGDVYRIEAHMGGYGQPRDWWRSSKSISGGILYDWGVHLLEYSLQIIDAPIAEVVGFEISGKWAPHTVWKEDTSEDEGFCVVRFEDGRWLTLCITTLDSKPKEGQLEITGTEGTYVFDGRGWQSVTHEGDRTVITKGKNRESEGWRFYQNVADHLVDNEPLVITGEWSRRPIHILDLACRSADEGRALAAEHA